MNYSTVANVRRRRKLKTNVNRVRNKVGVLFFRACAAVVLIAGFAFVGAAFGVYLGILENSPELNLDTIMPEKRTSIIYSAKTREELHRLSGEENRVIVDFNNIPENLVNAFVAIEDERFYSHNGVDLRGMIRAVYTLVRTGGDVSQGASTITQQLIKNKLDRFDSDLITKLQEQYLAVEFEKHLAEGFSQNYEEPDPERAKKAAKDYILGVYLNTINLGRGYHGVQTAAWNYYGKDVSELTLAECATIAAITKNPSKLAPDIRQENNRARAELVLENMLRLELITEDEFEEAWNENVYNNIVRGTRMDDGTFLTNNYFTDTLITQIIDDFKEKYQFTDSEAYDLLYNGGLEIFSTQDTAIQSIVDEVMRDPENFPERDYEIDVEYRITTRNFITGRLTNHNKKATVKTMDDVENFTTAVQDDLLTANDEIVSDLVIITEQPQASFIIIDYYTGQVKAMSGGRGEKPVNRSFNRATGALRSPGSQFKTLASYAPALDMGLITAASVIDDVPYDAQLDGYLTEYIPGNWYGKNTYEGLTPVRRALYRSMNILAVKNYMRTGIDNCFNYLLDFGFTTLVEGEWRRNNIWYTDRNAQLALGGLTDGIKQVELCAAYGTIANLGEYNKPIYYTRVLDHNGNVLLENETAPKQVIRRTTAYILTDICRDTIRIGTGTRAAFDEVRIPAAGKTGTSTDTKDLSFTGWTPYYVASVWMGFDQQKNIEDSNAFHLRIWKKIMEEVHKYLPMKEFERPDGLLSATVCRDSGMLADELCQRDPRGSRAYTEIFASGTQPLTTCEAHQEITVCAASGLRNTINCPYWDIQTKIGFVRPEPIRYDINPSAGVQDAEFEISREALGGAECTVHYFTPASPGTDVNYPFWGGINTPVQDPNRPVQTDVDALSGNRDNESNP